MIITKVRKIIISFMFLVIPINIFALLFGGAVLGLVLIRGVTNLLLQDCVDIVVVIIVAVITISILSTSVMLNRKVVP